MQMSNSTFEAKPNSGALFANQQKHDGSRQPDYRGYVLVGDTRVQLAGWKRMSKVGAAYLSLQVDNSADDGAADGKENASAET
jgi:uncharacterized protein (DUF736 family)